MTLIVSSLYAQILRRLGPLGVNRLHELHRGWEAIYVRSDDTFEAFWVDNWLNGGLVVPNEIIVKLNSPRLLLLNYDIANLQKLTLDLRVVIVEGLGALNSSRALEHLQNVEKLSDELLALSHQVFLVKMNAHIVASFKHLELHNIGLLLLEEILSEDVGTLRVSLTPLLCLSIVQLEAEDALSHLVHD